jgi:hypothetical protein
MWGHRSRRGFEFAALGALLIACLCASAASAHAVSHLSWQRPVPIDRPGEFSTITCSSTSFCIAADVLGNVVTSTDPAGGKRAWHVTHVDEDTGCGHLECYIEAISCPSRSFCAAYDTAGYVFTSTNFTARDAAWTSEQIEPLGELRGLSCPSASLCVAVNNQGQALISTDPTAGTDAWRTERIDFNSCPNTCFSGGYLSKSALGGISCPSVSLCVAGDWFGNVLASTDPASKPRPSHM